MVFFYVLLHFMPKNIDTISQLIPKLYRFIWISFAFFILSLVPIVLYDKAFIHLYLNQFHSTFFDYFFRYLTHVGDGLFPAVVLPIVLFLYRKELKLNFTIGAVTFVLLPLTVQFFKRVVFGKVLRPAGLLGDEVLYLIPDVKMAFVYSFPSGHSATIFAFFLFLTYVFWEKKSLQIVFASLAILGAYSRVYLSQHFLQDIVAGGVLGIVCFFVAAAILQPFFKKET